MDAHEGLNGWINRISLNLLALELLEEPDEFREDFTGGSLDGLERGLLEHFGEPGDIDDPERRDLADGAAGYLGEVLLRLAGGAWGWRAGEPVVHADKAVGLEPVFPLRLVAQAISEESERVFSDVYEAWEAAVARHRTANPQWEPRKERTPGVDPFEMRSQDAAYIAAWTAERRDAFALWRETYGGGVEWDFGPASLDALERLLPRITPSPRDLRDPAHRDFIEGAVWYFGEMIRRIRGGTWAYRSEDPEAPDDPYTGDPYVQPAGRGKQLVKPIVVLRDFVRNRVSGRLHDEYARWTR